MTRGSQRSGYRECSIVPSNAYNGLRVARSTDKLQDARQARLCFTRLQEKLQDARQTRLCFTRLQEVHTKVGCELQDARQTRLCCTRLQEVHTKVNCERQTRLCFTRLQEVHTEVNCEPVSKFRDKLNVKSRSDSKLCDDNGAVKKSVVATGEPLLNRVSQHRVIASECSSDSTSLQGIASQSEGISQNKTTQTASGTDLCIPWSTKVQPSTALNRYFT
ncbi:unnamed protein product [Trichobilharzia regenti]|nr:unnamed protein product [Trichobilharzia regenti]